MYLFYNKTVSRVHYISKGEFRVCLLACFWNYLTVHDTHKEDFVTLFAQYAWADFFTWKRSPWAMWRNGSRVLPSRLATTGLKRPISSTCRRSTMRGAVQGGQRLIGHLCRLDRPPLLRRCKDPALLLVVSKKNNRKGKGGCGWRGEEVGTRFPAFPHQKPQLLR